jgi:hypothetical protein
MITTSKQNRLEQSEDFQSVKFGIKESGIAHIFNVLRNQLYSDKVLAVIREYSTNAVDAHIEVGKGDVPIKVTLPTALTPEFKVRDFGRGLTEQQIGEIYAMYGESTKRGTNEQIGQLGLGSKSAFAYGDNFVINSFVKGDKTTYNAFIDPSDVGQISKIHSEKTDENDGIEIVIPVKSDDYDEFYRKATELYKYFKVVPDVGGTNKEQVKLDLALPNTLVESANWKLVDGKSIAVMGNIAYPLNTGSLNLEYNSIEYDLINAGVIIDFKIGDLEISASREALQYTDKTKQTIINQIKTIIDSLPKVLESKFDECKTVYDAKLLYNEAFSHGGFGSKIKSIVKKKGGIKFDNFSISNGTFDFQPYSKGIEVKHFYKPNNYGYGSKSKRVKGEDISNIYAKKNILVILDDLPTHHGRLNRIAPLIENYDERDRDHKDTPLYESVYLINYKSKSDKQTFLDRTGFDYPMKKLSEYPKVLLRDIYPSNSTVAGGTSSVAKNSKHTTKVFSLDTSHNYGSYHTCRSDFFKSSEADLDNGGVYVIVDKFYYGRSADCTNHPSKLVDTVEKLENAGIDIPEIYAMKPTEKNLNAIEAKDSDWVYFNDWAKSVFIKHLRDNNLSQKLYDRLYSRYHSSACSVFPEFNEVLIDTHCRYLDSETKAIAPLLPVSLARLYLENYNFMEDKDNKELEKLEKAFGVFGNVEQRRLYSYHEPDMKPMNGYGIFDDYTPTHDLNAINKELQERYPMLDLVDDSKTGYGMEDDHIKVLANYITLVEATYNTKKKIKTIVQETAKVLTTNKN